MHNTKQEAELQKGCKAISGMTYSVSLAAEAALTASVPVCLSVHVQPRHSQYTMTIIQPDMPLHLLSVSTCCH